MTSELLSPASNGRRPVSISYSTQPNAQRSVRSSTGLPRACSGLMYATVPRMMPDCVTTGDATVGSSDMPGAVDPLVTPASASLARPKSSTFTVPSVRSFTLAGLRSRCTMPCACAASSASAICRAMGSASSSGTGPCAIRSASVGPSTSSITSARVAPLSSRP